MKTFESLGIKVPAGATGQVKTICPSCTPHNRKPAHRNSKDLSVDIANGIFNCHNCGYSGSTKEFEKKIYIRPAMVNTPTSSQVVEWFKGRKISETTLKHFGISEKSEWMPQVSDYLKCIAFPYIKDGECVNIKFRSRNKHFKLVKDAELCIFNFDGVKGKKTAIITEGEIDALSVFEAGVCLSDSVGVCSVPNGASKGNQKLEYLDNSWYAFSECDKIIIATDADEPGIALKAELSRRLGKHRCYDVIYPEGCKDLNEVLINHGAGSVSSCLSASKPMPVEGIHLLSDFEEEIEFAFQNGFVGGDKVGYPELDNKINFSPGQLTVWTGVPGSGKSTFLDQILLRLANRCDWKHGICSFEKHPITKHIAGLSSCYIGKPFYRADPFFKMSAAQKDIAKAFLNGHFYWFKVRDEDITIAGIINRAIHLVKAYGIKGLVIDPYNYIENNRLQGQTETEYISDVLGKLCMFAKDYGVHVFLVAHPRKMNKSSTTGEFDVPTLYDISGSHNFYAKPDNGATVHRERKSGKVVVYIQKIRYEPENGRLGFAEFDYDIDTGRYKEQGEPNFAVEYLLDSQQQQPEIFAPEPPPHKIFQKHGFDDEAPF